MAHEQETDYMNEMDRKLLEARAGLGVDDEVVMAKLRAKSERMAHEKDTD